MFPSCHTYSDQLLLTWKSALNMDNELHIVSDLVEMVCLLTYMYSSRTWMCSTTVTITIHLHAVLTVPLHTLDLCRNTIYCAVTAQNWVSHNRLCVSGNLPRCIYHEIFMSIELVSDANELLRTRIYQFAESSILPFLCDVI